MYLTFKYNKELSFTHVMSSTEERMDKLEEQVTIQTIGKMGLKEFSTLAHCLGNGFQMTYQVRL